MRKRLHRLKKLRSARERLRDAAAIEVAAAELLRADCENQHRVADENLRGLLGQAPARMREVQSIAEIEAIAHEVGVAGEAAKSAEHEVMAAAAIANHARAILREKERELRIADKLIGRAWLRFNREVDRSEQRLSDDLTASRWRKSA